MEIIFGLSPSLLPDAMSTSMIVLSTSRHGRKRTWAYKGSRILFSGTNNAKRSAKLTYAIIPHLTEVLTSEVLYIHVPMAQFMELGSRCLPSRLERKTHERCRNGTLPRPWLGKGNSTYPYRSLIVTLIDPFKETYSTLASCWLGRARGSESRARPAPI